MIFKFIARKEGGHYHVNVYSSKAEDQTFGRMGQLIMDERDWAALFSRQFKIIAENRTDNLQINIPGTLEVPPMVLTFPQSEFPPEDEIPGKTWGDLKGNGYIFDGTGWLMVYQHGG